MNNVNRSAVLAGQRPSTAQVPEKLSSNVVSGGGQVTLLLYGGSVRRADVTTDGDATRLAP